MKRTTIINLLIKKYGLKKYLEIGLDDPDVNFNLIECETKHSVDPFFEKDHDNFEFKNIEYALKFLTFRMTSDEFFKNNTMKYDIIFIDGLHTERQCGKDIINALKHLNNGGFIVVHDCLPPDENAQKVPRVQDLWNGDVWKCIPELKKQFIEFEVVDCDFGCCVIKYNPDYEFLHYLDKSNYSYEDFCNNRNSLMNVITEEEFLEKYIK